MEDVTATTENGPQPPDGGQNQLQPPPPPPMFMPVMSVEEAIRRRDTIQEFIEKGCLRRGVDWDTLTDKPTDDRKILLKAGAENLAIMFGLVPRYSVVSKVEKWDASDGEALIAYRVKCELFRDGIAVGESEGSCNSRETKYRWRWVTEEEREMLGNPKVFGKRDWGIQEPDFAITRANTSGKYGKPAEYWQKFKDARESGEAIKVLMPKSDGGNMHAWEIPGTKLKIPNPEVADLANTILKMAFKRSHVASIITAVGAGGIFTQDLEDFGGQPPGSGQSYEKPKAAPPPPEPPPAEEETQVDPREALRERARGLYDLVALKLGLNADTDPPKKAIFTAIERSLGKPAEDNPEAVIEKLKLLLSDDMTMEIGRRWVAGAWKTANKPKPQPATKTTPSDELGEKTFATLNIPGMIVQLGRKAGMDLVFSIRSHIRTEYEFEQIPRNHDEIEEMLKALYTLDRDDLRETLQSYKPKGE